MDQDDVIKHYIDNRLDKDVDESSVEEKLEAMYAASSALRTDTMLLSIGKTVAKRSMIAGVKALTRIGVPVDNFVDPYAIDENLDREDMLALIDSRLEKQERFRSSKPRSIYIRLGAKMCTQMFKINLAKATNGMLQSVNSELLDKLVSKTSVNEKSVESGDRYCAGFKDTGRRIRNYGDNGDDDNEEEDEDNNDNNDDEEDVNDEVYDEGGYADGDVYEDAGDDDDYVYENSSSGDRENQQQSQSDSNDEVSVGMLIDIVEDDEINNDSRNGEKNGDLYKNENNDDPYKSEKNDPHKSEKNDSHKVGVHDDAHETSVFDGSKDEFNYHRRSIDVIDRLGEIDDTGLIFVSTTIPEPSIVPPETKSSIIITTSPEPQRAESLTRIESIALPTNSPQKIETHSSAATSTRTFVTPLNSPPTVSKNVVSSRGVVSSRDIVPSNKNLGSSRNVIDTPQSSSTTPNRHAETPQTIPSKNVETSTPANISRKEGDAPTSPINPPQRTISSIESLPSTEPKEQKQVSITSPAINSDDNLIQWTEIVMEPVSVKKNKKKKIVEIDSGDDVVVKRSTKSHLDVENKDRRESSLDHQNESILSVSKTTDERPITTASKYPIEENKNPTGDNKNLNESISKPRDKQKSSIQEDEQHRSNGSSSNNTVPSNNTIPTALGNNTIHNESTISKQHHEKKQPTHKTAQKLSSKNHLQSSKPVVDGKTEKQLAKSVTTAMEVDDKTIVDDDIKTPTKRVSTTKVIEKGTTELNNDWLLEKFNKDHKADDEDDGVKLSIPPLSPSRSLSVVSSAATVKRKRSSDAASSMQQSTPTETIDDGMSQSAPPTNKKKRVTFSTTNTEFDAINDILNHKKSKKSIKDNKPRSVDPSVTDSVVVMM